MDLSTIKKIYNLNDDININDLLELQNIINLCSNKSLITKDTLLNIDSIDSISKFEFKIINNSNYSNIDFIIISGLAILILKIFETYFYYISKLKLFSEKLEKKYDVKNDLYDFKLKSIINDFYIIKNKLKVTNTNAINIIKNINYINLKLFKIINFINIIIRINNNIYELINDNKKILKEYDFEFINIFKLNFIKFKIEGNNIYLFKKILKIIFKKLIKIIDIYKLDNTTYLFYQNLLLNKKKILNYTNIILKNQRT